MRRIFNLFRVLNIIRILLKYNIDGIVLAHFNSRLLAIVHYTFFLRWHYKKYSEGERLRYALEEIGPIFVKLGQVLSTRRDLFSEEISNQLAFLQDRVKPISNEKFKQLVEKNYGRPVGEVFSYFDPNPLGSASIAQVHAAKCPDGNEVVIKALRPNIHQQVAKDVGIMHMFASLLDRFVPSTHRFRPLEVVNEFKRTLDDELDMMTEGANASELRRNFVGFEGIYVPKVYWSLTNHSILVMERVYGININDVTSLKAAGTNMKRLAELGVEIFFTQVFRDSFFHADMHPGNVFVDVSNPDKPVYIAVDFGIMGSLDNTDKHYLAENFLAFFDQDYHRVAQLHVDSGWVPANTRVTDFEAAIRSVCEPIFGLPLKDISFGQTLLRLFQTARRFEMPVQPQLILLQKTLLVIEGVGRDLYPELDLWQTAQPFLVKWMKQRISPRQLYKALKVQMPSYIDTMPLIPKKIDRLLEAQAKIESHKNTESIASTLWPLALFLVATYSFMQSDYGADNMFNISLTSSVLLVIVLLKRKT